MRRIITALLVLLTTSAIAQNGGQITGKKNSGLTGTVMVDSVALKVSDSASRVYQSAIKLKTDSIYTRLGNGVNATISGVVKKTLGTQVVSTDTGLVVNAVMHGITTGGGGGYVDVKVNPSGALTVEATLDSATQRSTIKVSNFPTTQAVSGTFWQTTQPVSGTITTSPPSNASSNISQINGITPLMGNGVTGTGSQRVTIASDNTAFSVNTIPSASDSTKYRSTMQVSNFPSSQAVTFTRLKASTDTLIANLDVTDSTNIAGINSKLGGTLTVGSHAVTNAGTFAVQVDSSTQRSTTKISNFPSTQAVTGTFWQTTQPISGSVTATLDSATQRTTVKVSNFPATQPVSFTRLKASTDTVAISGTITSTAGATAIYDSTWTAVQMDTAGLGAMANSATVGWQSDSVGLRQHKCTDVKIGVKISMANTAPANDKAVYVYVYPIWYDGSTWYFTSGGTATFPSGANSTYTIASPNNLRLLGVLSYTTTNMVLQDQFILSNAFGSTMPDAFGLVIVDFSGAALHTTNHRIYYSLINKVQR